MPEIIITCVSERDEFAKEVYDYLLRGLERHKQHEKDMYLHISEGLITLAENEIRVSDHTRVPKKMIKWVLQKFLKSDISRFKDFDVIEFGDMFTIGRILPPSKMEMATCEICGFFTPYSEEIHTHRMTHFGI